MFTSSGSTGGGRGGGRGGGSGGGDAKTIISPNTSFGDIIRSNWSRLKIAQNHSSSP